MQDFIREYAKELAKEYAREEAVKTVDRLITDPVNLDIELACVSAGITLEDYLTAKEKIQQ